MYATIHTGNASVNSSLNGWHTVMTDAYIRPINPVVVADSTGQVFVRFPDNDGKIYFKTVTNNNVSLDIYAYELWHKR